MRYFVRIYRRYDFDLYTLAINGYRVDDLIRDAVTAYAHEKPFHVYVDRVLPPSEATGKGKILYNITIDKDDKETTDMLRHVIKGFRNNFFKSCVRNALLKQNLSMYFPDKEYLRFEKANMLEYVDAGNGMEGLHSLSIYRDSGHNQKEFTEILRGTESEPSPATSAATVAEGHDVYEAPQEKPIRKSNPASKPEPVQEVPHPEAPPAVPATPSEIIPAPASSNTVSPSSNANLSRSETLQEETVPAASSEDMHSSDDPNDIMSMFDNL